MLKFPISSKEDRIEALMLNRRKLYEEARKKRIFNAKTRLFGVDVDALDRQVHEKKMEREAKRECQRLYDESLKAMQTAIYSRCRDEEKELKMQEADINQYRCYMQRKEDRREFDLNDPNYLKDGQPARVADYDPRLGISSAQVFKGEDLGGVERRCRQKEQQRAWLDEQKKERRQDIESREEANREYVDMAISRDNILGEQAMIVERRKTHNRELQRYANKVLAQEKRNLMARRAEEKLNDDMAEIYNMLTSDMLSESKDNAQSRTDPKKKIAYMYRGMTDEELLRFRDEQYKQYQLNKQSRAESRLNEKNWEQLFMDMDRQLCLKTIEEDRKRADERLDLARYNRAMAEEHRMRREQEEYKRKNNTVEDSFFEQFNRTSR